MKKSIWIGAAALAAFLPALAAFLPALAACGAGKTKTTEIPEISAPIPEISVPEEPRETPPAQTEAQYILVRVNGLNVRSGAGVSFASLGQTEKDVLLKFDGAENDWYKTYYRNRPAYVSARAAYTALASLTAGGEKTEAVVEEGLRLLGTPYVYGATRFHDGNGQRLKGFTADAFDCSSLMQYIFYRGAGVLLDVTTRTQVKQGEHVEKADLRRGDLLFFTNASRQNKTGLERVGHVALYLGENYILHTASDYAKVEQISAARWNYFLEARRVL